MVNIRVERKLSKKQQRFIDLYNGNGTETARQAGYAGSDKVLGITAAKLLGNARVLAEVRHRESKEIRPKIVTRLQRQEFWTRIMSDEALSIKDRLRASELLGKSEADFSERIQIDNAEELADRMANARRRVNKNSLDTNPPIGPTS